ncbi:MAG: DUF4153 domain-containing protein, partial [Pseudobutyrivibrio sp.]|nr:DUF4153 domain-containing protein [Pseudobutyrivibrio sp.]
MKIIEKVKDIFKDAINEHRCSFILFLSAMVCQVIDYNNLSFTYSIKYVSDILDGASMILIGASFGVLLCEAIHLHKKEDEGYNLKSTRSIIVYAVIILVGLLSIFQNWFIEKYDVFTNSDNSFEYAEMSYKVMICLLITILGLSVFFFYKRGKESFETYLAKAFCGLMKAELVYGIIAIGTMLIIWAFNTLIIDTDSIDLMERLELLIIGLVQFPCAVVGISKTDGKLGRFAKAVLSYVFTILTAIAFVIIYIYIIKILVTWSFPSNQVFTILASLFSVGVIIWTMAQGCCDTALIKPLRIMPLLFIPFIVLQIMCLSMRVMEHGYTSSRYFGLALIIAEVIYFIIYIYSFIKKQDIMFLSVFIIIIVSYLVLLVPGVNAESVVTVSQKKIIETYISKGDDASEELKNKASSALHTIDYEGGLAGQRYLNTLSVEQKEELESYSSYNSSSDYVSRIYLNAENSSVQYDIAGYDDMYIIDL